MHLLQSLFETSDKDRKLFSKLSVISLIIVLSYACTNEVQSTKALQGNWLLEYAERSGRPTTTLKDAYFNFIGDTLMRTNLLQEEGEFSYKYTGETIEQSGDVDITYDVLYISQDTLVLNTNIEKYNFKFLLLRDTTQRSVIQ